MSSLDSPIEIPVEDGRSIPGTLVAPATAMPGVLFVQGWGSGQEQYLARAREIAALGCVCLTFDLTDRGPQQVWRASQPRGSRSVTHALKGHRGSGVRELAAGERRHERCSRRGGRLAGLVGPTEARAL